MPRGVPKAGFRAPRGSVKKSKAEPKMKKNVIRKQLKAAGVKVGRIPRKVVYDSLSDVVERLSVLGLDVQSFNGHTVVCDLGTIQMAGNQFYVDGRKVEMPSMVILLK